MHDSVVCMDKMYTLNNILITGTIGEYLHHKSDINLETNSLSQIFSVCVYSSVFFFRPSTMWIENRFFSHFLDGCVTEMSSLHGLNKLF